MAPLRLTSLTPENYPVLVSNLVWPLPLSRLTRFKARACQNVEGAQEDLRAGDFGLLRGIWSPRIADSRSFRLAVLYVLSCALRIRLAYRPGGDWCRLLLQIAGDAAGRRTVSLPLLERLTIALVAVLLVSALVGWIKYDIERTAASQPATRAGMNSAPIGSGGPSQPVPPR